MSSEDQNVDAAEVETTDKPAKKRRRTKEETDADERAEWVSKIGDPAQRVLARALPDLCALSMGEEQAAAVEAAAIKDAADFFAEFGEAFDIEETDWEAVAWTSGVSEETMPGASGEQQAAGLALYTAVLTRETKRLASE